jgi:HPt (histidine-containing phosphotransfer) domain-containing protein
VRNQSLKEDASVKKSSTKKTAYPKQGDVPAANHAVQATTEDIPGKDWISDYCDNDYATAECILGLFLEEVLPETDILLTLLYEKNIDELRQKVHKISPSFKMVGLPALAAALKDIEVNCSATPDMDHLEYKIKVVQARAEKVKPLMIKQFNSISKLTH